MHDEDNALGLWVRNKRGEQWKAYGDNKLYEKGNEKNKTLMKECLQASADEIYTAFQTRKVPNVDDFAAWKIAPTSLGPGNHNPLFDEQGHYRSPYDDPKSNTYKDPESWWKTNPFEGYRWLVWTFVTSEYFKKL